MRCNNCFEEFDDELEICPHCGYTEGMEPKEAYMLFAGTTLQNGKYIIGQVLGFGGFGIIYKAYDTKLERVVAIKEYYPAGLVYRTPGSKDVVVFKGKKYKDYANGLTRFLDEAKNATKFINNPNIIDIMEYFEENGTAYFVMELLVGLPLDKFLAQCGGKIDTNAAISIVSSICFALRDLHKEGYIHRDIAPDNIYMCDNGKVKLFDFGATRFSAEEDKLLSVIVKPGYAPVEQYETINKQGPWTDVYALGATMYRMVTGVKPEESTNRKICDTVPAPNELNPDISENLSNAIMRAMAVEKHLRYQNVDDFLNDIKSEKKVVNIETVKKRKKRYRFIGIAASLFVVGIGYFIFQKSWNEEKEIATLPDANITLWYSTPDGEKSKGFEKAVEDFVNMYGNITIDTVAIREDEYEGQLVQALETDNGPTIYETTGLGVKYTRNAINLKNIYSKIDKDACYFVNNNNEYYASGNKIQSSFIMPVVFVNTSACEFDKDIVDSLDDFTLKGKTQKVYSMDTDFSEYYNSNIEFSDWNNIGDGILAFVSGDSSVYFGSSRDIEKIYETMSGKCKHYTLEAEKVVCIPGEEWSISKTDADSRTVAERFMTYLVEDPTAQDFLYMQGEYGDKTKIPVNKAAIETLLSDDAQNYELILKNVDKFSYQKEKY